MYKLQKCFVGSDNKPSEGITLQENLFMQN